MERMTVLLTAAEEAALRTYAEREQMTVREAARRLLNEAIRRRETEQRCTQCNGTGWV